MYYFLTELINSFTYLDDLVLGLEYLGLNVEDITVGGKRVAFVSRPQNMKFNGKWSNLVAEEITMVMIDEALEFTMISLPRMTDINNLMASVTSNITKDGSLYVEEWLVGNQVTVSFQNNEFVVSTETDPFGRNIIPGTGNLSYQEFVIQELEKANPDYGLSILKKVSQTPMTWVFTVVPKSSHACIGINHELYLVSCIDMDALREVKKDLLWTFGYGIKIKTPHYRLIKHPNEIPPVIGEYLSNGRPIKGIILSGKKEYFRDKKEIKAEEAAKFIARYSYKKIEAIARCILNNRRDAAFDVAPGCGDLIFIMCTKFDQYLRDVFKLFKSNQNLRTRKHFALEVSNHPMHSILYALREGCGISGAYINSHFTAKHLVEMIIASDATDFYRAINCCKEQLCQKER